MAERGIQFAGLERAPLRTPEKLKNDPVGLFIEQCNEIAGLAQISASTVDFSYLSPEQRAESLWATFQEVKGLLSGRKAKGGAVDIAKMKNGLSILKNLYEDSETRDAYLAGSTRYLKEIDSINGNYEKYQALDKQINVAQDAFDASARQMFAGRSGGTDEIEILMFETNKRQLSTSREQLQDLVTTNPELGGLVQYETLREYSKELRKENFIWSPSRRHILEKIETAALSGKPVLLAGESGTGKTRLTEQAAIVLTGQLNTRTPGKNVRHDLLIAKQRVDPAGDFFEYKEVGRAATGKRTTRDEAPTSDGQIVLDDEFNLKDPADQTELLSTVATWTPGKKFVVPVTGDTETVAPNFLYIAAVNLASERYKRQKIGPEVLRKFVPVDVGYPPQSGADPEIYEMMMAALIDENGRMRVAKSEVAPEYTYKEEKKNIERDGQTVKANVQTRELAAGGGFLWRFANALNELNKSFSHNETVLKAKGDAQYVKDLIIDIGTVLGWLKEHGTLGRTMSLEAFIGEKLKTQFLDRAAYTNEDRKLVKEFLKHFAIDIDNPASGEDQQFKNLTAVDIGLLSPRVKYEKVLTEEPEVAEGTLVNEDGERIEYFITSLDIGGAYYTPDPKARAGHFIKAWDGKVYEFLGVTKDAGEPVLLPYKQRAKLPERKSRGKESKVSVERAEKIFGSDFLGVKAVEATFGVKLDAKKIPEIPFSEAELERAKELGQFLVLRTDKASDRDPLTMEKMNKFLEGKFNKGKKGKILFKVDWYPNEDFYKVDVSKARWALVSKENIPNSTSKNYLQQTQELAKYVTDEVFKDTSGIPKEYQDAIDEFERYYAQNFQGKTDPEIQALLESSDWPKYAQELGALKINQLTRQTPTEVLYDLLIYFEANGRLLKNKYTWTNRRSSGGYLVGVGRFDADGADVGYWRPDYSGGDLGVFFSRSL